MRVLASALTMLLLLYACSQPPEVVPDDELFECDLSKDGKFLVCHERKRTRMASDSMQIGRVYPTLCCGDKVIVTIIGFNRSKDEVE